MWNELILKNHWVGAHWVLYVSDSLIRTGCSLKESFGPIHLELFAFDVLDWLKRTGFCLGIHWLRFMVLIQSFYFIPIHSKICFIRSHFSGKLWSQFVALCVFDSLKRNGSLGPLYCIFLIHSLVHENHLFCYRTELVMLYFCAVESAAMFYLCKFLVWCSAHTLDCMYLCEMKQTHLFIRVRRLGLYSICNSPKS